MSFDINMAYLPPSYSYDDHLHLVAANSNNLEHSQYQRKELDTIARRYDFKPLYIEREDEMRPTRNDTHVFFQEVKSDFIVSKDPIESFCYLCSIGEHVHEHRKARDESQRRKLIPYNNPKALRAVSVDRIPPAPSLPATEPSNLLPYRFIIRTGTEKNAGTRSQAFLYLYGTEKNWTAIPLHSSNVNDPTETFPRGSIRSFCLKGPDIGQLHHVNVNLVGSRSDKEWFLKEIEITNLRTSVTWLCEFNCWLPKQQHSKEYIEVKTSETSRKETSSHPKHLAVYLLMIRTGEKPFVGSISAIEWIVRGTEGVTRRLTIPDHRGSLFQSNQLDTFALMGFDIGEPMEICLELTGRPISSAWDLKEISMKKFISHDSKPSIQRYFPMNISLGGKTMIAKGKEEVYPMIENRFFGPISYQIQIKPHADVHLFLVIYGKCGRSIIHQLKHRSKSDFQRSSKTEFTIMDIDVGPIEQIKLWPDPSKSGPPPPHLESISITKKYSTCQSVAEIFNDRLEQISHALYRRAHSKNIPERLGSSRSILRSPTISDKVNFHKKVTWDEQSLTSQDDFAPSEQASRTRSMTTNEEKNISMDHQVYWISSHNYLDQQWMIRSIEETQSFDFDSSTRSRLLSDRLPMKNSSITMKDENYQFNPQTSATKDKQMEMILTPLIGSSPRLLHSKSLHRQDSIGGLTGRSTSDSHSSTSLTIEQEEKEIRRPFPSSVKVGMRSDLLPRAMHSFNDNRDLLRQKPMGAIFNSHLSRTRTPEKKEIHDRIYQSAYGTIPADDF